MKGERLLYRTQEYAKKAILLVLVILIVYGIAKGFIYAFESLPERVARFAPLLN